MCHPTQQHTRQLPHPCRLYSQDAPVLHLKSEYLIGMDCLAFYHTSSAAELLPELTDRGAPRFRSLSQH